jgi:hypothetical protein
MKGDTHCPAPSNVGVSKEVEKTSRVLDSLYSIRIGQLKTVDINHWWMLQRTNSLDNKRLHLKIVAQVCAMKSFRRVTIRLA